MLEGKIVSINISSEKGTIKQPVSEGEIGELGLVGDAHAGPWHRQISLLGKEDIDIFSQEKEKVFKHGDFAENITVEGLKFHNIQILDILEIGEAKLLVTQIGKACHGSGCSIFNEVGACVMPKEGIFTQVIKPGKIKVGDTISCIPKTLHIKVITLSDRASKGIYTDRSGPELLQLLEKFFKDTRWHPQFHYKLLPDNAELLEDELKQDIDNEIDIIFTTGGTGVGPRDITSEVVVDLSDKIIPGIMDYIRIKCGEKNPKALLSRSVAVTAGKSIIYALPGSKRAISEYMEEIVKTMEHIVFTLHGLDLH